MKVSTLKAKVQRLWIDVEAGEEGGPPEKIWVDYKPGGLTLEVSDKIKTAIESGFEADVAYVMLSNLVVAWDLQDDDGVQLEVTEASIKQVPIIFLGQIMQGIEKDARPNAQRDATSEGTLPPTEPQEASLTGTTS